MKVAHQGVPVAALPGIGLGSGGGPLAAILPPMGVPPLATPILPPAGVPQTNPVTPAGVAPPGAGPIPPAAIGGGSPPPQQTSQHPDGRFLGKVFGQRRRR